MAVETTDYQAVLSFIREVGIREAHAPSSGAPDTRRDERHPADWIPGLGLDLSADVGAPLDAGQRLAEYQVFAAGWCELEGVMILQPETEFPADVRAAIAARNERALRELLRAFPRGKTGCFSFAGEWMLGTLAEFFEGRVMPSREGYFATPATFLGIKRGSGSFVDIPNEEFFGRPGMPRRLACQRLGEEGQIRQSKDPILSQFRDLAHAAGRREHSQFAVEGLMLVQRAIGDGLPVDVMVYTPDLPGAPEGAQLLSAARAGGIRHYRVTEGLMGRITTTRPVPVVVAAIFAAFRDVMRVEPATTPTLLVAEQIGNPDNLGMVLRTADAAGVTAVVVIGDKPDPFHKNCVRAARGAVGRIPIHFCHDAPTYLRRLRQSAFRILGATSRAETDLYSCDLRPPIAFLVGNEQTGISPPLLELCSERVRIPMASGQDSLNVGVASGVLLYELLRQRTARC